MLDETILSELKHLDLTGCITAISPEAAGQGAYSEVFKGRAHVSGRDNVAVAIKRLRFHVKSTDCKLASDHTLHCSEEESSFLAV